MADEVSIKPKKELTEAQKLAFLKGREKRLANIEKKRLEKEEAAAAVTPKIATPVKVVTPPPPIPEIQPNSVASFDMDTFADKVAERIMRAQTQTVVPPKPKPNPKPRVQPQQFTWL